MGFVENLAVVCFLCVAGCVFMAGCAGLCALLSKFAPAWLRDSFLGSVFGLDPDPEPGEITAADVLNWNARNIPANDNND